MVNIADFPRPHFKYSQILRTQSIADKMSKRTTAVLFQTRRTGLNSTPVASIQRIRQLSSQSILLVVKLHAATDPLHFFRFMAAVPQSGIKPVFIQFTILKILTERIGQVGYGPLRRNGDLRNFTVLQISQDDRIIRLSTALQEILQLPKHSRRPQLSPGLIDPAAADIKPLLRLRQRPVNSQPLLLLDHVLRPGKLQIHLFQHSLFPLAQKPLVGFLQRQQSFVGAKHQQGFHPADPGSLHGPHQNAIRIYRNDPDLHFGKSRFYDLSQSPARKPFFSYRFHDLIENATDHIPALPSLRCAIQETSLLLCLRHSFDPIFHHEIISQKSIKTPDLFSCCIILSNAISCSLDDRHHPFTQFIESVQIFCRIIISHTRERLFPQSSSETAARSFQAHPVPLQPIRESLI